jgi:hypothetical protein
MGISEDEWDKISIAMGVSIVGIPRWMVYFMENPIIKWIWVALF